MNKNMIYLTILFSVPLDRLKKTKKWKLTRWDVKKINGQNKALQGVTIKSSNSDKKEC